MKILKPKRVQVELNEVKEVKTKVEEKAKARQKMPPDAYKDEIVPKVMELSEDAELRFSVKRAGELGLPYVDIRVFMKTDKYTGFTKKGFSFPLELLQDFMETLSDVDDECEEKGVE